MRFKNPHPLFHLNKKALYGAPKKEKLSSSILREVYQHFKHYRPSKPKCFNCNNRNHIIEDCKATADFTQ